MFVALWRVTSADLRALITLAGYGTGDPVVVGVQQHQLPPVVLTSGQTSAGDPLTAGSIVYTGSLSKQMTAACVALLVRQGRLDPEESLAQWMPELPAWSRTVRLSHLLQHTSGLPKGVHIDDVLRAEPVRTTAGVVRAVARIERLATSPGTEFVYCNAGYVCLGVVLERAAGRPLPEFAGEHVFGPLGMADTRFWSGPAAHPPAGAPLDPAYPAPLSLGDGGVWSTVPDLLRWNETLDADRLGVSALLHTSGRLADGTPLGYGWGIGVRELAGHPCYRHAGGWPGSSSQLVRVPGRGLSFAVVALDEDEARVRALADSLIDEL